ncbi:MAG: DUF3147 family protein [Acidimicrobiia bacterium]|nr:DUF3147 family protein [Acidimicrobiia bacterium]
MSEVGLLALRGLAGGGLVVVFALIAEVVTPKAFSGLFSAAPSVALASLAITVGFETATKAGRESTGMVTGAIGMAACCVVAAVAIPKLRALWGSAAAWLTWVVVGLGLYWAVFVGAH